MKNSKYILLFSLLFSSFFFPIESKTAEKEGVVSGIVINDLGKPLGSVIVKLYAGDKEGPYATTDKKGKFMISVESGYMATEIRFSKLGYEPEKIQLTEKQTGLEIVMSKSASTLREVTVSAPEVRLRGDTVTFLLSAFAGKGDITLKDAIKKVPGINVAESGEISYNGKNISNFYIEGMDLLGGKYDVATTNIPASYVNAIEIINNHHDKKIDQGIFSDKVALNVRLKKEAMFRPTGTYALGAGIGKPLPLEASGAGMMFRKNFQSILTLKGTDIEEFSEREQTWYSTSFDINPLSDLASNVIPNLSGYGAPLRRVSWVEPVDAATSLNFMNKKGDDTDVRTNIDYAYRTSDNTYSDTRFYYDGKGDIEIRQTSEPHSESHTPKITNEYRINKENLYFSNSFSGEASFVKNRLPVTSPSALISQNQQGKYLNISENAYWTWKRGNWNWLLSGTLQYVGSPQRRIRISEEELDNADVSGLTDLHSMLTQRAKSNSFFAGISASASTTYRRSRFMLPFSMTYSDEYVYTFLNYAGAPTLTGSTNDLSGKTFNMKLSPGYNLTTEYEKFFIMFSMPMELKAARYRNAGTFASKGSPIRFMISPNLYFTYNISAKSSLMIDYSYADRYGDLMDYLTSPVMTDYLSAFTKSGILSRNRMMNTSLLYRFTMPVSMWYANMSVSYSKVRSNIQSSLDVTDGLILSGTYLNPTSSETINTMASLTKNISSIKSKITLNGSYRYSENRITQNNLPVKYYNDNWDLGLSLSTNPCKWFEFDYNGSFSKVVSRYLKQHQSFITNSHDIALSFFPIDPFQIKLSADITNREIEKGHYKTSDLFDFYMAYKFKKFRISLRLRNLFDCRNYSYTVFNGLDRFNYNYTLRGRQLVAKISFTI